ncbi:MAG: TRAP transporter large permease subunit [Proteobacteria bacterium]|nr:TRAP transporter large permease subunit [Pseudomonadota bacterium]
MIAELVVLFGVMLAFMALGIPVFISMALAEAAYVIAFWPKVPIMVVAQGFIQGLNNYHFAAIVFFFLAGEIMNAGGITDRLLRFTRACFGHIPGSLSHVNILASMVFAGVSGSAMADASAIGSIIIPAMKREGYSGAYSAAVTSASATIGPVIPPSIPLVLFGLFAMTSIGRLFIAGIIPGILMGVFLLIASYLISRARNYPATAWVGFVELLRATMSSILALIMPLIVVVGLVGGVATVSEVGAVAAAYAVIVSMFIYRELSLGKLWQVMCKVGSDGAKVLIIVSIAGLFIWIIGNMGVARLLAGWIGSLTSDPRLILALMAMALLIGGTVLDPVTLFAVFVPIMVPTAAVASINLTQLGVVAVLATMLGLITPPVGMLVFLTSAQATAPAHHVFKELIPFLGALLLLLVALIVFPQLSLWLPDLLRA